MGKPCTEYVNALSLDLMELFLFISVLFFLNIIIYSSLVQSFPKKNFELPSNFSTPSPPVNPLPSLCFVYSLCDMLLIIIKYQHLHKHYFRYCIC